MNCRAVVRPELKNILAGTSGAHQGRIFANEDIIKKRLKDISNYPQTHPEIHGAQHGSGMVITQQFPRPELQKPILQAVPGGIAG